MNIFDEIFTTGEKINLMKNILVALNEYEFRKLELL